MIELEIPVEQIPYIRTIEGRKFKNGKWQFPDTAIDKLIALGLVDQAAKPERKKLFSILSLHFSASIRQKLLIQH